MASYLPIPQAGFKIATSRGNSNQKRTLPSRNRDWNYVRALHLPQMRMALSHLPRKSGISKFAISEVMSVSSLAQTLDETPSSESQGKGRR